MGGGSKYPPRGERRVSTPPPPRRREEEDSEDEEPWSDGASSVETYVEKTTDTPDEETPTFKGKYQPPGRLLLFELIVFIILVYLLFGSPGGGTLAAISSDGKGGVGLLKSCTGGSDCTSWLGGAKGSGGEATSGSGGGGTTSGGGGGADDGGATAAVADSLGIGARDLHPRQSLGDATSSSSSGSSSSGGSKSQSDPTTFHLTTGLASICLFYTLSLALLFHIWRWWSPIPPPPPGSDEEEDEENDEEVDEKGVAKKKRWWKKNRKMAGVKRFGWRVSKGFTLLNACLMAGIMFGSIMMASSSGFGYGTALLILGLVLLVLVAWIEHLGPKWIVGRLLLKGQGRLFVPGRDKSAPILGK